jgi:hypothetical protein
MAAAQQAHAILGALQAENKLLAVKAAAADKMQVRVRASTCRGKHCRSFRCVTHVHTRCRCMPVWLLPQERMALLEKLCAESQAQIESYKTQMQDVASTLKQAASLTQVRARASRRGWYVDVCAACSGSAVWRTCSLR